FALQPVERVQLRQVAQNLRLRQREPAHLLAHRDRVLVQARSLVRGHGVQVALAGLALLALLVEQVRQQHEVVRIGFRGLDQLLVLPERAIQIAVLDAALGPALDLDRLFQVGWPLPELPARWGKGVCPWHQAFMAACTAAAQRSAAETSPARIAADCEDTLSLSADGDSDFRLISTFRSAPSPAARARRPATPASEQALTLP